MSGDRRHETGDTTGDTSGDRRQETQQETRQESGVRSQETGDRTHVRRQETCQESGDRRQETRQETGDRRHNRRHVRSHLFVASEGPEQAEGDVLGGEHHKAGGQEALLSGHQVEQPHRRLGRLRRRRGKPASHCINQMTASTTYRYGSFNTRFRVT